MAEPKTYISKCVNQRLTIEPAHNAKRDEFGNELVPAIEGVHVQFENHVATVSDPKIQTALEKHWLFNNFGHHSAFWLEAEAPDEPKPTVKEQVAEIIAGLKADDRNAVEAVLVAERSSHNRDVVIAAGEDALSALKEGEQSPDDGVLPVPIRGPRLKA